MEPISTLELFWAGVIAFSILAYVILDGFDLGVGILFGPARLETRRRQMIASIAPFWDGNETWLIVVGAGLFAAFPAVYAVFLGAFYLPVLLMLIGLIFRGVAFEFRERSLRMQGFWDTGFWIGSIVVAFVQGAAVGALMRGVAVSADHQYAGDALDWLHPFPVLTGLGMVAGYALLGAGWLVLRTGGEMQDWARTHVARLGLVVLVLLGIAFLAALTVDISPGLEQAAARFDLWAGVFSAIALVALLGGSLAGHGRRDWLPFALTVVFFLASFLVLGRLMWPYMIPYALTVQDAAAPPESLGFLFWGAAIVLPVILIYTAVVYTTFRHKVPESGGYE